MRGGGLAVVGGGSMGTRFRPYQPDQMLLLPRDLRSGFRRVTWRTM